MYVKGKLNILNILCNYQIYKIMGSSWQENNLDLPNQKYSLSTWYENALKWIQEN